MAIEVRRNGAWVDNTQEKKRVNGAWVSNSPYKVMKPTISGVPPFTFKSDGENLRDWSMTGQTVQASTPSPANPVSFDGVGERTGNLFDVTDYSVGTTTFISKRITLEPNTEYTMSSDCPLYNMGALIVLGNVGESFSTAKNGVYPNHSITRTTDANGELLIGLRTNGSDYEPADYETMLNIGNTARPFEPFGYKIPINVQSGNLFDYATMISGYRITWTNGNLYADDTAKMSDYIAVSAGTYSVSIGCFVVGYDASKTYIGAYRDGAWEQRTAIQTDKITIAADSTVAYIRILTYASMTALSSTTMLNRGSTPLPYQPYSKTTTNIYLGSATSTRRIKKLVLTGSETVSSVTESTLESGAYCFACLYSDLGMTDIIDYDLDMRDIPYPHYVSEHFKMRTTPTQQIAPYTDLYAGDMGANARKGGGTSNRTFNRYIIFCVSGISTVADFKAWLAQQYAAGTPVTIWYVLAEPETAAVNEPLMKIGTYADEITKTGTGVNIPTVSGSNTLTVGTTVQPSEMSIESISQWV